MALDSDERLMQRAMGGDTAALAAIVERYYGPILSYLYRSSGGRRQVVAAGGIFAAWLTQFVQFKGFGGTSSVTPPAWKKATCG